MGSQMDEAWQILHHMRTMQNPLAVKFSYLFSSLQSNISLGASVARICGAKSYRDLDLREKKFGMVFMHAMTFAILFLFVPLPESSGAVFRFFFGGIFNSCHLTFFYKNVWGDVLLSVLITFSLVREADGFPREYFQGNGDVFCS